MKQIKNFVVAMVSFFLLNSTQTLYASSAAHIYGAQAGCSLEPYLNPPYILQLAAFSNQHNAAAYQEKLKKQGHALVNIQYQFQKKAPYQVYIGPLNTLKDLKKVSCALLSPHPEPLHSAQIMEPQKSLAYSTHYVGKMGVSPKFYPWSKIATLSLGSAWVNPHPTEIIQIKPNLKNEYRGTSNGQALVDGELFLGVQRAVHHNFLGQIGLAVAAVSEAQLKGDQVSHDGNNNLLYAYNVNHTHLALKAKLLAEPDDIISPYVSGSLGVGLNHAYDFYVKPMTADGRSVLFESNTTTALTYTLGAGIQTDLNASWQIGVGYEFADWGRAGLGRAAVQTLGDGLQLNHVYSNELQLNLTYSGFI
ncbi:MAG: SPOR domain-containing protein [Legionellaceae bacterium]